MAPTEVTMREHPYLGWSAWHIQHGPLELVLVPRVGGRVMRFAWQGEDLCFTHPDFRGRVEPVDQIEDIHTAKQQMGFRLWGGEKTWLSPQTRWTDGVPFLDLDSGPYTAAVLDHTPERARLQMTSPVCRETGVQVIRTVTVAAERQGIEITHTLVNASPQPIEWGLWSVSQFLKPARIYLPRRPDSRYPEGVKTFVEEGESTRVRPQVVRTIGTLAQITCEGDMAFKFGVDGTEGWVFGVCDRPGHGQIGYVTTYAVAADPPYGHECTAEVFNSDILPYIELEVHSPLLRLAPGERAEFQETRRLFSLDAFPTTEDAVRRLLSR